MAQVAQQSEDATIPKRKLKQRKTARLTSAGVDPASFPPEFDPKTYRSLHSDLWYMPDEQLWEHYQACGKAEGRRAHPLACRDMFRDLAFPASSILELGPFFRPMFTGPRVRYFDVLNREGLLALANELGHGAVDVPKIDYVSARGDLSVIADTFDVVASSHVIEHQPDLAGHLQQVAALLRPGGYYFLFIPDKRYCFDYFMPESTIADIVEAADEQRTCHTLRTLIRQQILVTHNEPLRHWRGDHGAPEHLDAGSVQAARRLFHDAATNGSYIDRHAWQFTPDSFRLNLRLLNELGLVALRPLRVYDTLAGRHEFWVIMCS